MGVLHREAWQRDPIRASVSCLFLTRQTKARQKKMIGGSLSNRAFVLIPQGAGTTVGETPTYPGNAKGWTQAAVLKLLCAQTSPRERVKTWTQGQGFTERLMQKGRGRACRCASLMSSDHGGGGYERNSTQGSRLEDLLGPGSRWLLCPLGSLIKAPNSRHVSPPASLLGEHQILTSCP